MNKEAVMIDFSLPNNPDTLKFIKLNQSDKLKAVTLGSEKSIITASLFIYV